MRQSVNRARTDREVNLIEKRLSSPTVTLILVLSTIGAFIYIGYLIQPAYRGDILPYTMVLASELFLIIQSLLSFWTILNSKFSPRNFEYHHAQDLFFGRNHGKDIVKNVHEMPNVQLRDVPIYLGLKKVTVDVFIPVYGEQVDVIRETALAARDMYGMHQTYILDDGESDEVQQAAEAIGVQYIRRPVHDHAKAGNINNALRRTHGKLFVILDADFVADPRFLYETVPFFEDKEMAFVQTPQFYGNNVNFVSTAASYMQHVFYAMVLAGKNRFNSAFCVGTNVVFQRKAIESIGGLYEGSKSEDIWTAMILHEHGYRSIYINKVLAIGKTPETLKAYVKQQLRWATGSFEIFLHRNPLFNKHLTWDQRLQYLSTTSFYFNGFAVAILVLLPPLQIFFNITPIALDIPLIQWAALYCAFYLTQLILSFYAMGGIKWQTLIISAASFPVYIKAFFNALFRRDQAWQTTNSMRRGGDSAFNYIRFQTYVFIFLLLTSIVGIWKAYYTTEFSISIIWNVINTIVFAYIVVVGLHEKRQLRKTADTKPHFKIPVKKFVNVTIIGKAS